MEAERDGVDASLTAASAGRAQPAAIDGDAVGVASAVNRYPHAQVLAAMLLRREEPTDLTKDRPFRRFPDLDFPHSDDPHVLRSQLLQMKAKMKEYASKAEAACYEV